MLVVSGDKILYSRGLKLRKLMQPEKPQFDSHGFIIPQGQTQEPGQPTEPAGPPKKDSLRTIMSTLGLVLAAFSIAFVVMFFVFRSYQVEGPSMEPTLHNGDRLIIWKMPRTWARITGNAYIPNRGDIVVFAERGLVTSNGNAKQLIKRVVGIPGDRVVIEDGTVTVFNKENPDGFKPDVSMPYGEGLSLQVDPNESVDEQIGEDQVYVLGDNRNNSLDSRVFGPIHASDIVGKLILRVFPIGDAEVY